MSENDIVDSGIELPRMATVQPLSDYVLRVKWAEGPRAGREDLVDVSPAIFSYKVYRPLRDESLFLTGTLAEDGDAVAWGNEDLVLRSLGLLLAPRLNLDAQQRGLTQRQLGILIGRSHGQIANCWE